ncbi:MAG: sulfotransferase [Pseudolabrys sp.]
MHNPAQPTTAMRDLRAAVFSDAALQARLADLADADLFAERLLAEARARGIAVTAEEVTALLRPDPLALARFAPRAPDGAVWPNCSWIPVHAAAPAEPYVDWLRFGAMLPAAPFFQDTVRSVQHLPFSRAFRYRMRLADFIGAAETGPDPDGLIFHMSRCGSTLVAQMLAALPDSLVLSEPPALDEILQLTLHAGESAAIAGLRAAVAAFGRRGGRPFVIKLDAWHALALPLFRRAFPDTPWVFLHRDPVEVLVSQMRQRGMQMLPQYVPSRIFGFDDDEAVPDEDYCARVLGAICNAAAVHAASGGGLVVDYRDLPEAVFSVIAPHFGVTVNAADRVAMEAVTERDVKAPHQAFTPDGADKRRDASESVRQAVERHLDAVCRRLAAMR